MTHSNKEFYVRKNFQTTLFISSGSSGKSVLVDFWIKIFKKLFISIPEITSVAQNLLVPCSF
jgi:hypothetical protein